MAGLLDFLGGGQAQMPGQQPSGLARLFQPEIALPMAAALLGGQGNAQNFGNAFAAGGQAFGQQKELQAQTAQKNQTIEMLKREAPDIAAGVETGALTPGDGYKAYLQRRQAQKGQGIINAGAGNLYNADTGEWLSAPGGGVDATAGLSPVWLWDEASGRPILGQMRKDGSVVRSEMPENTYAMSPYERSFETGAGGKAGEATGTAAAALPAASMTAKRVSEQVEALKNHSSLGRVLGPLDSRTPNIFPGSVDAQSRIDQLSGGAFLEARQALKGGGAITDFESQKAEKAYARLNQATGEAEFKAALDEFNLYVQQGLQKLQTQAGMGAPRQPGYGQPLPAGPSDYKTKYGLD